MRTLSFLLLAWSMLLADTQAQTVKESHDAAVAAIKKLGGRVTFDRKNPGKLLHVDLSNRPVTDAGLEHLKGLTDLRMLSLKRTGVTSAGVKDLQSALPKCRIVK